MPALTRKNAARVAALLNEHAALTDAIHCLDKKQYDFGVTVSNQKDDSDFLAIGIDKGIARQALMAQRATVEAYLASAGIKVER